VNELTSDLPTKKVIEDVLSLYMFQKAFRDEKMLPLVELHNLLGTETFARVVDLMDGKTVTFPTREDFRETIQIALCYYEKNMCGKNWQEVKDLLNDQEISAVKMGVKTHSLQRFLEYYADRMIARKKK
jgi:hypothetical protein